MILSYRTRTIQTYHFLVEMRDICPRGLSTTLEYQLESYLSKGRRLGHDYSILIDLVGIVVHLLNSECSSEFRKYQSVRKVC
jgi:hypothetical protein